MKVFIITERMETSSHERAVVLAEDEDEAWEKVKDIFLFFRGFYCITETNETVFYDID